jgi:hypothetical protein
MSLLGLYITLIRIRLFILPVFRMFNKKFLVKVFFSDI